MGSPKAVVNPFYMRECAKKSQWVNRGTIYSGTKKKEELCWFAFCDYLRTTKLRESPGSMDARDIEVEIEKRETEMALPNMQKKNLNHPDDIATYGLIKKEEVVLDGVTVHRVTFDKGAKWSKDLKPYAGTESCLLPHVAYVQSGRLHIVMNDGTEDEFGPNDIMMLPPGHDAWAVGDEPCVFIEFSAGGDYYTH